jgi:hypothetical protein
MPIRIRADDALVDALIKNGTIPPDVLATNAPLFVNVKDVAGFCGLGLLLGLGEVSLLAEPSQTHSIEIHVGDAETIRLARRQARRAMARRGLSVPHLAPAWLLAILSTPMLFLLGLISELCPHDASLRIDALADAMEDALRTAIPHAHPKEALLAVIRTEAQPAE